MRSAVGWPAGSPSTLAPSRPAAPTTSALPCSDAPDSRPWPTASRPSSRRPPSTWSTANLPPGATLLDRGTHRLKDLAEPEHVFELQHPDLRHRLPAPPLPGRSAAQPAYPALQLRRSRRGARNGQPPHPREPAGDAARPGRHRQDPARPPGGGRPDRPLPERRLVRRPRQPARGGPDTRGNRIGLQAAGRVGDNRHGDGCWHICGPINCCWSWTTSSSCCRMQPLS